MEALLPSLLPLNIIYDEGLRMDFKDKNLVSQVDSYCAKPSVQKRINDECCGCGMFTDTTLN